MKTLGKWFNDVYNKRVLYSYSKDYLYILKKIQQTKMYLIYQCILIHILIFLHNRSVLSYHVVANAESSQKPVFRVRGIEALLHSDTQDIRNESHYCNRGLEFR